MDAADRVQHIPARPLLRLGRDSAPFEVDANIAATGRTCVIGASGSGKSYAVGVICEELCKNQVPFAIIDTEGEHCGLKDKYAAIWVGDEQGSDLQWSKLDLGQLGSQAPDVAPLILDLSEAEEPKQKVSSLLTAIYAEVERRRTPYLIIVEEADRFIPQNGEKVPIFGEIARRGRKRGVGLMVCTQRPSLVDKNILSQCGNQLIGKLVIKNDLQAVAQFFQGHDLPKQLTTLPAGMFYAMGGLSGMPRLITFREKETKHRGSTPTLATRVVKPFRPGAAVPPASPAPASGAAQAWLGINSVFREEEIPDTIKRGKAFVFFGQKEVVTQAQLVQRPMVELGVTVKAGVLRKRIEIKHLVVDAKTGRFVDLRETVVLYDGLQKIIELSPEELEILWTVRTDRESSALVLANALGVTRESLRRPLRELERRRLIRASQAGRSNVFRRIYSFPSVPWQESELTLEPVYLSENPTKGVVSEKNLREIISRLVPGSGVQTYREFVYPLYRVELVIKRRKRVVWLDGRTREEFHP